MRSFDKALDQADSVQTDGGPSFRLVRPIVSCADRLRRQEQNRLEVLGLGIRSLELRVGLIEPLVRADQNEGERVGVQVVAQIRTRFWFEP